MFKNVTISKLYFISDLILPTVRSSSSFVTSSKSNTYNYQVPLAQFIAYIVFLLFKYFFFTSMILAKLYFLHASSAYSYIVGTFQMYIFLFRIK